MKKSEVSVHSAMGKKVFKAQDFQRPGLSVDEVNELKEAFDLYDVEQTGTIDLRELKGMMSTMGFETKNQIMFQMVADMEAERARMLEFPEFLNMMTARVSERESRASIAKVFALFDEEKAKFISIKNLRKVAKELGETIDENELQEMIERADFDSDGLVSEEDFYSVLTAKHLK